jgi:hypothetical protein
MATTTPNFGWAVPTSTDLVKDGAVAIETLGDSIDASLVDLKGGTTGQVLSKASNTDMDFTWVTDAAGDITGVTAGTGISGGGTSGTVTVTNSMATTIDAKGDLIGGTGADAFARLAVGANGTILTADSAEATGMKWAAAAGGGATILSVIKSADQSVTSNTSPVNDSQLKFAVAANEKFLFQVWLYTTSANSTPCMVYTASGPSGSTVVWSPPDVYTSAGGTANSTGATGGTTLTHFVDGNTRIAVMFGTITNGSTAGDLQIQWAQNTSSATATTVKAGSYIYGIKVS